MTTTQQLYDLILRNCMKTDTADERNNFKQNITNLLSEGAQIFANIHGNHGKSDRVFCEAVRLGNTVAIVTMLEHYKKNGINFRMQAQESSNHKWNLLQYVCIHGTIDMMLACFDFVGDPKEISSILKESIKYSDEDERHDHIIGTLTLGEIMATRIDQRTLIEYLGKTLNKETTYSEQIKQQIKTFFKDLDMYSNRFNLAYPQINETLINGINIRFTGLSKLLYLVEKGYIDVNALSTRTNISFEALVDGFASPYSDVEKFWHAEFKDLLIDPQRFEFIKVEENADGTPCLHVRLLKNTLGEKINPIYLKLTIDYRDLNKVVQKIYQESQKKEFNRSDSLDHLKEQMSLLLEPKINDYLAKATQHEKACFLVLLERTKNHLLARQVASTGLITPNTTTDHARLAKAAQAAFSIAIEASPINLNAVSSFTGMCVAYITNKHAAEQTQGVFSATIETDMPNRLFELSKVMTEAIIKTHKDATASEVQKIAEKIAITINKAVDNIHTLSDINEYSVREYLLESAVKALGNIPVNKSGPMLPHHNHTKNQGSGDSYEIPGSSSGSDTSSKKNRKGGCNIC